MGRWVRVGVAVTKAPNLVWELGSSCSPHTSPSDNKLQPRGKPS